MTETYRPPWEDTITGPALIKLSAKVILCDCHEINAERCALASRVGAFLMTRTDLAVEDIVIVEAALRDSGRPPKGEDATAAECEAGQSGRAKTRHRPKDGA